MPLVVGNAALMRLIWNAGGVPSAVNVYGVDNASSAVITQALTNTVGAAVKAALTSSGLGARLGSTISLANVGLRSIASPNQPEFMDAAVATACTGSGDLLPLNVSLCVTLRTALAGRSFRGRSFIWGWTETDNTTTGAASATAQTSAKAFVDAIETALASSGLHLAVVSRTRSSRERMTSTQVRDGVWDTIRKRAIAGI